MASEQEIVRCKAKLHCNMKISLAWPWVYISRKYAFKIHADFVLNSNATNTSFLCYYSCNMTF